MPTFIPLDVFKQLLPTGGDFLNAIDRAVFIEKLQGFEGETIRAGRKIDDDSFARFIRTLEDPTSIVFFEWVSQNKALEKLLLTEGTDVPFQDKGRILSHQLFSSFQHFISPYLADVLLKHSDSKDYGLLARMFSYLVLLDEDHRTVVENQLFKSIKEKQHQLIASYATTESEEELTELLHSTCSEEVIACVNFLSKASYASKMQFVDDVLLAIKSKACTIRLANWILKQMEQITLNSEHQTKIVELRLDLKDGVLAVRNNNRGRLPINWRKIPLALFILFLFGFAAYLIINKPFSTKEEENGSEETSFTQFSKEERIRIDSLIQTMKKKKLDEEEVIDPYFNPGMSTQLHIRKPFKNDILENLYQDLSLDAQIKNTYRKDSCLSKQSTFNIVGPYQQLNKKIGLIEALIRNESDYDVIIYVAENKPGLAVYAAYLKAGETQSFLVNLHDVILTVAGEKYQVYKAPSNAKKEELPSRSYTHHFCDTDANYEESFERVYTFTHLKKGKTKIMLDGSKGDTFRLIDVNGVMEEL